MEKKKGLRKKHIPYVIGGALFVFLLGWIIFGDHAATLRVDARSLTVGEVRRDQFNDFFRVDGQVQPITVVQLSPEEGGIVQEKVVEEGAKVKRGDVIVRLSNSNLDLEILNAEAELAEKRGVTMTEISLAWLLTKVTSPVVGATKYHHVEGAAKATQIVLTPEETAYLEAPYVPHNLVGVMAQNTPSAAKEKHVWSTGNQKIFEK